MLSEKIENQIMPVTESGCWIWMGGRTNAGYGAVFEPNKTKQSVVLGIRKPAVSRIKAGKRWRQSSQTEA